MSRRPEASPRRGRVKRLSSSRLTAMLRSALSWMLSLPSRARARRQARRQARTEAALKPLLWEALVPMAEALLRLEHLYQEQHRQLLRQVMLASQQPETKELLLEILQSLQPSPDLVISQRLGLPTQPPSRPSSAS